MNEVTLGQFMGFYKDFQIPLSKAKITEVFKKCSLNHKAQKFEQFVGSIKKIGVEINKEKSTELKIKLRDVQKKLKEIKNQY